MGTLEIQINAAGKDLLDGLARVIGQVPGGDAGPQRLAKELGIDKVLASRILKAIRAPDPMSVVHRVPGPEPMRRLLKASSKLGVNPEDLIAAHSAVDRFESLIRTEIGDRSALDAILSTWVPEARREFELRRKQAAFRAMSQLKGAQADVYAEAVIIYPSKTDPDQLDIVWIKSIVGLYRLRPGVTVKFTSRRRVEHHEKRVTTTLDGRPMDGLASSTLNSYCSSPAPELDIQHAGESIHYLLKEGSIGASSSINLVTCDVNLAEIPRYIPAELNRKFWVANDIDLPSRQMHFDIFVHKDLYTQSFPELRIYDTAIIGQADINDPSRDVDQFDLLESIENLGVGINRFGSSSVPNYRQLLDEVCDTLHYDTNALRGYRCTSDYPIYGSQYAMTFQTQERES